MEEIKWVEELAWPEFKEALKETDIGVIPAGSIEEHGFHAPLGTDGFIVEEICERIARRIKVLLWPVIWLCNTEDRQDMSGWPGTISIGSDLMANIYFEFGKELVRHGIRRILFVNGHFQNCGALTRAAFKLFKETGASVGMLEWFTAAHKEVIKYSLAPHADQVETSLLLVSKRANLVDMKKAVANSVGFPPFDDEKILWERALFDKYTFTADERYLDKGNLGDPRKATKEIGDEIINVTVEIGVAMLEAMKKHVKKPREEGGETVPPNRIKT